MKNEIYLDKKATEIVRKVVGGGGTIKVDELPEVGKEHTIYELSEQVEVDGTYNWGLEKVVLNTGNLASVFAKVIETSTDLPTEIDRDIYYVRTEDKLFLMGKSEWIEIPHAKDDNDNDLVGIFIDVYGQYYYSIVKDCLEKTEDGSGTTFKYVLLDDTRYDLFLPISEDIGYITLTSKLVEVQVAELWNEINLYPTIIIQDESQLPTYEQAVEQGIIIDNDHLKFAYATLDGNAWSGSVAYILGEEPEITWSDVDVDIIHKMEFDVVGLFVRQNGEIVTKTSYWVYSDNKWYNVDDLNAGCSIFVEVIYSTITPSKMWSAPKLSEIITECNYTITDLENYDWVNGGGETDVYGTKSTGIISGLPITSMEDRDFTEIVVKIPNIDVSVGQIYVSSCYFNNIGLNSDGNNQYSLENYAGGYLLINTDYQALN